MARTIIRVAVTLLVAGFWIALFWRGYGGTWGITDVPVDGHPYEASIARTPLFAVPMPPGVAAGDRFDRRALSSRERLGMLHNNPDVGSKLHLDLQRGTTTAQVTLRATPAPMFDLEDVALRSLLMLQTLLGLLLLWRGRDWVAWGLATFALCYGMKDVVGAVLPLDAKSVSMIALRVARDFGLYVAVRQLVRPAISRRVARVSLWAFLGAVAAYAAAMLYFGFAYVLLARYSPIALLAGDYGMALAAGICAMVMAIGYRHAGEALRLRIRWVVVGVFAHALAFTAWASLPFWLVTPLALLAVLCFAYAALRHRLVDVSFAVSRTLVYGTVVLVVVGAFAILEHAIAGQAIGKEAGLVLHLIVPLVLGITLHKLRERVEHVIERLFFRRQFEAERALLRLAHESAYMEREDRLLARTLHDIARHVRPQRVAIYQRADGGYERIAHEGTPDWPSRIDADDPAFVALRSGAEQHALSAPGSALGRGGIAFPMSVAGRLEGVVVCGDRAQQYTRDERELLRRVTHEVGAALQGLKAQRSERLLEALARGTLSVRDVRERVLRATP
ncbi:MAG TPA: GAF domain-containing protein [Lysobacter sp.]